MVDHHVHHEKTAGFWVWILSISGQLCMHRREFGETQNPASTHIVLGYTMWKNTTFTFTGPHFHSSCLFEKAEAGA